MSLRKVGTILDGKYEIAARLGSGGMGEVYRVRHLHLDQERVVKILRHDLVGSPEATQRFIREARTATQIKHPNVATLYDFARLEDGSFYMVWEHIEGIDVDTWLRDRGHFPLELVVELGIQALRGLVAIHEVGVIHRDISPDNLIVSELRPGRHHLKIIDLGLAKELAGQESLELTDVGSFLGKLRYCSPEQAGALSGEPLDLRSDLYSLATVVYEMACGLPPFESENDHGFIMKRREEDPLPLTSRNPDAPVPPPLAAVIEKGLARNREERYPSAVAFVEALAGVRDEVAQESDPKAVGLAGARSRIREADKRHSIGARVREAEKLLDRYIREKRESPARMALETLLDLYPNHPKRSDYESWVALLGDKARAQRLAEERLAKARERLVAGDLEAAERHLAALERDAPAERFAETLRVEIEEARRSLQERAAVDLRKERLQKLLAEHRLEEAEQEIAQLSELEITKVTLTSYRSQLDELRSHQERERLSRVLEDRYRERIAAKDWPGAREAALELEHVAPESRRAAEMFSEVNRLEDVARRQSSIEQGVRQIEAYLAAGRAADAELGLKILTQMDPDNSKRKTLERRLRELQGS